MVHAVSDTGSNAEENIAQAANVIGRSEHRRAVFNVIYTGKRRAKKVSEIMDTTKLPHRRVLDAGKRLADHHLVNVIKQDGETAYEKIGFYHANKAKILRLAESPAKLKAYPTKRNPVISSQIIQVKVSGARASVQSITIDEIDSFRRVRAIDKSVSDIGDEFSEKQFKNGIQRIIGEGGKFQDWGGEVADLFTSRVNISGRRRHVALALKGPGAKGRLVPGKMGRNGDQIQRLFEAPADVFLVQYCRQIDPSVLVQMKQFATVKSLMTAGKTIYYGVVDGQDSRRLVLAYPGAFYCQSKTKSRRRK